MPSYGLEPNVISSHTVTPADPETTEEDSLLHKASNNKTIKTQTRREEAGRRTVAPDVALMRVRPLQDRLQRHPLNGNLQGANGDQFVLLPFSLA